MSTLFANCIKCLYSNFLYEDSNCNSKDAIGLAFKVYEDGLFVPDLILGPICSGGIPNALICLSLCFASVQHITSRKVGY